MLSNLFWIYASYDSHTKIKDDFFSSEFVSKHPIYSKDNFTVRIYVFFLFISIKFDFFVSILANDDV